MIKWLFKYAAVIFLFNTVLLNIEFTFNIGSMVFVTLMGTFLISLLINPLQIKTTLFQYQYILITSIIGISFLITLFT